LTPLPGSLGSLLPQFLQLADLVFAEHDIVHYVPPKEQRSSRFPSPLLEMLLFRYLPLICMLLLLLMPLMVHQSDVYGTILPSCPFDVLEVFLPLDEEHRGLLGLSILMQSKLFSGAN
jgi:hypothetical protein